MPTSIPFPPTLAPPPLAARQGRLKASSSWASRSAPRTSYLHGSVSQGQHGRREPVHGGGPGAPLQGPRPALRAHLRAPHHPSSTRWRSTPRGVRTSPPWVTSSTSSPSGTSRRTQAAGRRTRSAAMWVAPGSWGCLCLELTSKLAAVSSRPELPSQAAARLERAFRAGVASSPLVLAAQSASASSPALQSHSPPSLCPPL